MGVSIVCLEKCRVEYEMLLCVKLFPLVTARASFYGGLRCSPENLSSRRAGFLHSDGIQSALTLQWL